MSDLRQKLREAGWRGKLTPVAAEQLRAWLAKNPGAQGDWEAEEKLTALLASLPDVPVPTNFTARVLQAVERDTARAGARPKWSWRRFLPKMAVAAVLLTAGVLTYHESTIDKQRMLAQRAQSVAAVLEIASLPGPEVLRDFEAIRELNSNPPDRGLLTVFSMLQ